MHITTHLGWLKQQLGIQAAGLSGHLPLFWADIENSSWIGGNADGGLHERTPYWLNGFIPLAYQLKDSNLIAMVEKYISYILAHQTDSGWLGLDDQQNGNCYWSKYPVMFALRQYYEATGNSSVLPAMFKFLHTAHQRMFTIPLGGTWYIHTYIYIHAYNMYIWMYGSDEWMNRWTDRQTDGQQRMFTTEWIVV